MKAKGGTWTYDELFKFLKSPQAYINGTKMSFAGISRAEDRINLIAFLRTNADSPAAIPAPKPATAAAAPAAAAPPPAQAARRQAPPHRADAAKTPGAAALVSWFRSRTAAVSLHANSEPNAPRSQASVPSGNSNRMLAWQARRASRTSCFCCRQVGTRSSKALFGHEAFNSFLHGKDHYAPQQIDYFVGFRPPHGFLKTLPRLKAIFSLGAGVDGFLRDPEFPRHLPVVRFVDETLQREMAQYVTMHSLIIHRHQRAFDAAQKESTWRQRMLARPSRDVRIGILGMGDIGAVTAERLQMFDFQVFGWSRTRKDVKGVTSFAGPAGTAAVPGPLRYHGVHAAADAGDRRHPGRQTVRRAARRRLGDECRPRRPLQGRRPDRGAG